MNEYHGARHLFHRLPVELKDQTNFITLWEILKHLWNKRVHDALTILLNTSWSTNDTYLIDSMVNEIRSAEIRHISLIYRSMYVKDLEARLLLSTDDVIALCSKHGWHMDEDSALSLTPVVTQIVSSEVDAQIVDECMKGKFSC